MNSFLIILALVSFVNIKRLLIIVKRTITFFKSPLQKKEAGASFTKYLTIDYSKCSLVHGKYINNCTLYNKCCNYFLHFEREVILRHCFFVGTVIK
jgi:hypothetical protein